MRADDQYHHSPLISPLISPLTAHGETHHGLQCSCCIFTDLLLIKEQDYNVNVFKSSAYLALVLNCGWHFFHTLKEQLTWFWLTSFGITQSLRQCHSWFIGSRGYRLLRRLWFNNGTQDKFSDFSILNRSRIIDHITFQRI